MKGLNIPIEAIHRLYSSRLMKILQSCESVSESDIAIIHRAAIEVLHTTYGTVFADFNDKNIDIHQAINRLQHHVYFELNNQRIDSSTVTFARLLDLIRIPFNQCDMLMIQDLQSRPNDQYEVVTTLRYLPTGEEKQYNTPVCITSKSEFTSSVTKAKRIALRGIFNI
ncbi:hypothetical protein HV073_12120 [Klebsiella michiganensis]|uniref:hypothetical protein n=1 Tax=Klebsiella/Raoultella group TaxID=2890311 RepID=UPI000FEB70D9|nr:MULTISPECIES: hypothetical protein [Klebsiella/Raoultella group]MBA8052308.1 hypothetical protein [Klebsiella michiganensis]MDC7941400.1 hypothetical protein [Raoultella ornithinolytica]RWT97985.1 hypothetical protein DN602_19150 [Raoultella ornithinolytica]